jgi:hypothetical protein
MGAVSFFYNEFDWAIFHSSSLMGPVSSKFISFEIKFIPVIILYGCMFSFQKLGSFWAAIIARGSS